MSSSYDMKEDSITFWLKVILQFISSESSFFLANMMIVHAPWKVLNLLLIYIAVDGVFYKWSHL